MPRAGEFKPFTGSSFWGLEGEQEDRKVAVGVGGGGAQRRGCSSRASPRASAPTRAVLRPARRAAWATPRTRPRAGRAPAACALRSPELRPLPPASRGPPAPGPSASRAPRRALPPPASALGRPAPGPRATAAAAACCSLRCGWKQRGREKRSLLGLLPVGRR
jgi:hypothetical protein